MSHSTRGIGILTVAAAAWLAVVSGAGAQVLSAPGLSNNSTADELNLSTLATSWDRQSQVTTLSTTGTSFQVRYGSSVSCDSGAFGSARTENMTSDYTISFTVTAPAGYYLDVDTRRTGDLSAHYDGGITGGSATLSGVSGVQTGGSVVSGSLDLADPTDCNIGGGTTSSCNQPFNQLATARFTGFSNGVPVTHTLKFTWTQSTFSAAASGHEGAVRMGLQGRDTTNDASQYPGSPARMPLSNDGHFVTVTLTSLCGNGTVDAGEQCDQGAANGNSISCCTATCQFRASGQICRPSTDICDTAETCTGSSGACPADGFAPAGQSCRGSAGACDVEELCTGLSASCPPDQIAGPTVVCRAASPGEVCDENEYCDGLTTSCPADQVQPMGTTCRAAAGVCDLAESCDGTSKLCPNDAKSTALCRAGAGVCDVAESCDGVGNDCPANGFQPASVTCRAAAGVCDVAEHCSGTSAACPSDAKSTAVCRAAAGICDVAESCDGVSNSCPADQLAASGTLCRAAAGVCDVAETCTGASASCPANGFQPNGTSCSDGLFCNGAETCNGSGSCVAGPDPCPAICSEGLDQCLMSGCPAAPLTNCRTAQKSLLLIKNKLDDSKDKLTWKWIQGQSTSVADLADPLTSANYAVCLYAGPAGALVGQIDLPPGAGWSTLGTSGYRYFDFTAANDGVQRIMLKGSTTNKSRVLLKGAGGHLPDPIDAGALTAPVRIQLVNHQTGTCFESAFAHFQHDTTAQLKAKVP